VGGSEVSRLRRVAIRVASWRQQQQKLAAASGTISASYYYLQRARTYVATAASEHQQLHAVDTVQRAGTKAGSYPAS